MLGMQIPSNLVSDSALVQETFELICASGGRATFIDVAENVFRLTNADKQLASALTIDLIQNDPRFIIDTDFIQAAADESESAALHEIDFVVLDVEAINDLASSQRIIELAAYRVRNGQILEEFQTLVNPELRVPRFVAELTGISEDMLKPAPKFVEIIAAWLDFIDQAVLVAHNTSFDLSLLNREIARVYPGLRLRNSALCTVNLARRLVPQLANHKLDSSAAHFGVQIPRRHRAPDDALATARIFLRLLHELSVNGICTLAQARTFQTKLEVGEMQLAFDT